MISLATLLLLVLIPIGVVEPKKVKYAALSPSYYPKFVTYALLAIGLAVTARSLLFREAAAYSTDLRENAVSRYCWFFVVLALYAVSISWLGFVVTSMLALMASFWLADEHRLYITLPIALLLPIGLYFFFLKIASVPIPLGILEPWLAGV